MKKVIFDNLKFFGSVGFIIFLSLFQFLPFSCKMTEEGFEIVAEKEDTIPPNLVSFRVLEEGVNLEFSENINLRNIYLADLEENRFEISRENVSFDKNCHIVNVKFPFETEMGKDYIFGATVSDLRGNSLDFEQEFIGFNKNPAKIIMSEIRIKGSANSKSPQNSKAEFIEFYVLKGGNLAGTEIEFGYHKKNYKFPFIEVKTGEYIVLHLKSYGTESEGFIDELEDNLNLSKSFESTSARDLWIRGTSSIVTQNDVVAVIDKYSGKAVDGAEFCAEGKSWSRANQKNLATLLNSSKVWNGETAEFAAKSDNISYSRTLSRQNIFDVKNEYLNNGTIPISNSADWIVVKSATIGEKNSNEKYVK